MLYARWLGKQIAKRIRPHLANPENVVVWGNVRNSPAGILEGEEHAGPSVGIGGVNDHRADSLTGGEIVCDVTSGSGIERRTITFAVGAKIMVEADQNARVKIVGKPDVDVRSVVEGNNTKVRIVRERCAQA